MLVKLYKKDHKGKMRFWEIFVEDDELTVNFGTINGEIQQHTEYVDGNTLREPDEQALLKAESKISNRIKRGFRHTIEEAELYDGSNELGYHKPMLAARWDKMKNVDYENSTYQHKFDGHRCLITNDSGEKIAYSRNGKLIHTINHVLADMDIPEGVTIDGELYIHNMKLQKIASLVKRNQPDSKLLKFHCYDTIAKENFEDRLKFIRTLRLGQNAHVVDAIPFTFSVKHMLKESINLGYEGLIVRPNTGFVYEDGKRSKGLIKVKQFIDGEFLIVDITSSKDGWAILHCITDVGEKFTASAPGNMQEKRNALIDKHIVIGRYVRLEFAMWTNDKIPFHPVAIGYRQLGE